MEDRKEPAGRKPDELSKTTKPNAPAGATANDHPLKTREGSPFLRQLYSTARTTASATHSNLRSTTTLLVNMIPIDKVDASELQVRSHFDDQEIDGLCYSIKQHGVLQPILTIQDGDRYKVIAGERRLRAAKRAGLDRIPARVLSTDDKATHEIALRENLDRVDLHPLEEGEAYLSLLEAKAYISHDAIAKAFHKPKSRITECIGFTKLPDQAKGLLLKTGIKSRSTLRKLLTSPPAQHAELIEEAVRAESRAAKCADSLITQNIPDSPNAVAVPEKKKKPSGFAYRFEENGLAIQPFRWKVGEGNQKLEALGSELRKLVREIDQRLNKPPRR